MISKSLSPAAIVPVVEQSRADLVVIGGTLAGLSVAIEAREAGVDRVVIVEPTEAVAAPEVIGQHGLTVHFQSPVARVSAAPNDMVVVKSARIEVEAKSVVMAIRRRTPSVAPSYSIPPGLNERVHLSPPEVDAFGADVLVVGSHEDAAEYTSHLASRGANVVLSLGGADPGALSRLARHDLLRLEAERRVTIFWKSAPDALAEVGGFPMAYFPDRRTPDLQFDHVVFRLGADPDLEVWSELGVELGPVSSQTIFLLDPNPGTAWLPSGVIKVGPGKAWETIRSTHFPQMRETPSRPSLWREGDRGQLEELRALHYNATITVLDRSHSDLWLVRVKPDHGDTHHLAGQYASLGLGYWESRADGARDRGIERIWNKMIRRSYSISSPLVDDRGYLFDPCRSPELEFYIVLVPPSADRIPGLTPRLALKQPGDRIYLGPKVTGRYTLAPVEGPDRQVIFLATGTGEAPHNAMAVDLLRSGHQGPIASVVSVRFRRDLGYLDRHLLLEARFPNYHYFPIVTREPDEPKIYVQDVIREGLLEDRFGVDLDPETTHVYLCGNPAMIGLPQPNAEGDPVFPSVMGASELLSGAGFSLDRRGVRGNVHYEEYW